MITHTPYFIDFSTYSRPPCISAHSGFLLTVRLLRVAPKGPPQLVYKSLLDMRGSAEAVHAVLRTRQRLRGSDLRPFDQRFDGSWGALFERMHAYTRIDVGDRSRRAAELIAKLFPDGLVFLTAAYEEEWLHGDMLLTRIEDEDLEVSIDELAGPEFLAEVREAHEALGEALGLGEAEIEQLPKLAPVVTRLAHAIANYGRLLAGTVDLSEPKSVAMFEAAMAPRDAFMARQRRKPNGASEAEEHEIVQLEELEELEDLLPPVPEPEAEAG